MSCGERRKLFVIRERENDIAEKDNAGNNISGVVIMMEVNLKLEIVSCIYKSKYSRILSVW